MSCPVTMEKYTEENFPVSLPCGHTISSAAAKSILDRSFVFTDLGRLDLIGCRKFICPTCRGETIVKAEHKFPKNYAVLEVLSGGQCDATTPNAPPTAPLAAVAATTPVAAVVAAPALVPVRAPSKSVVEFFIGCDVSGSMGALVNTALGLTRLDLVIYNVTMLLRSLASMDVPGDATPPKVTLIAFTGDVRVVINRTEVTQQTLDSLILKVSQLKPLYTTNIEGALRKLLSLMVPGHNNIAVILTDGQPTDNSGRVTPDDPRGYVRILKEYDGQYKSLSMMGYGHRLSHKIMLETARAGNGACTFGSDESMISNVFIRWISWALTAGPACRPNGAVVAVADAADRGRARGHSWAHSEDDDVVINQAAILLFCRSLEQSIRMQNFTHVQRFLGSSWKSKLDSKLLAECVGEGQINMAFQPSFFNTWGLAYLHATLRSHEIGHQWNFKDESLNTYSNSEFDQEVARLDRIFQMMPPPTPSKVASESVSSHGGMANVFNNSSSTCWAENSTITMADGSSFWVQDIRAGMEVTSYNPDTGRLDVATVKYVLRQPCQGNSVQIVPLGLCGRARMTPNHPILDVTKSPNPGYYWAKDYYTPEIVESAYVYNFILTRHHHIMSDDTVCVTMGHGMTEVKMMQLLNGGIDVVVHSYFGDMGKMIVDCERIGVDAEGYVTINDGAVVRDPETGYVVSFAGEVH
jgi:hypothetical protein